MAGSVSGSINIDRESSTFDMYVDWDVPGYSDPETGEYFGDTSWNAVFTLPGGGTSGYGGYGSESGTEYVNLGLATDGLVHRYSFDFTVMNTFSGEQASQRWTIVEGSSVAEPQTLAGTAGRDIIIGGADDDVLRGLGGDDVLDAGDGDDVLFGGGGNDQLAGGAGANVLVGGAGNDIYTITSADDRVIEYAGGGIDLVLASVDQTLAAEVENLTLTGVDPLDGTGNELGNRIVGNGADNVLRGLDGDDTLSGLAGNDRLEGGSGNDTLDGGDGNDKILSGAGLDVAHGGNGDDFIYLSGASGSAAYGDAGDDQLYASGRSSFTLRGGDGNDNIGAWSGNDKLYGDAGDDLLYGYAGNDRLYGGAGTDRLIGGTGNDILYGGDGLDYFIMNEDLVAGQQDKIMDFQDGIDLVGLPLAAQGHVSLADTGGGALLSTTVGNGTYSILFAGATAAQVGDQIYYYG